MKDFESLIKNRRSTRKFTQQLLSPEQVEKILKAGLMAPASKRKNPWQFVVVEDKEMLHKLAECKPHGAAFLEGCALAVVVLGNIMESDAWVEDCSIAAIFTAHFISYPDSSFLVKFTPWYYFLIFLPLFLAYLFFCYYAFIKCFANYTRMGNHEKNRRW